MKYLLTLCLFGLTSSLFAQSIEVGGWLGATNSFDDLNNNSSFATVRPAGGLLGKYNFNERIAGELMFSYGTTFSADEVFENTDYTLLRNEASKTTSLDVQLAGEFNFLPFGGQAFTNSSDWTPYLSTGIGISLLSVERYSREDGWVDASSTNVELNQDLNPLQINVPIAGGVKFQLNDSFVLSGEFGTRLLFNDYYDNVSTVYTPTGIEENPGLITVAGKQRGDRSRNDAYNLFGAQLTYVIPLRVCP